MQPIFTAAKNDPKRIVYAEGEDERVLRAVQTVVDEGLAAPVLVGRREADDRDDPGECDARQQDQGRAPASLGMSGTHQP